MSGTTVSKRKGTRVQGSNSKIGSDDINTIAKNTYEKEKRKLRDALEATIAPTRRQREEIDEKLEKVRELHEKNKLRDAAIKDEVARILAKLRGDAAKIAERNGEERKGALL